MIQRYTNCVFKRNKLYLRGLNEDGVGEFEVVDYQPTVWVERSHNIANWRSDIVDVNNTDWRLILDDRPLTAVRFKDIKSAKDFINSNKRYAMDEDGHSSLTEQRVYTSPDNVFISQYLGERFKDQGKVGSKDLKIYSYDIETEVGHRDVSELSRVKIRKVIKEDVFGGKGSEELVEKTVSISRFETFTDRNDWELYDKEADKWVSYEHHPYRWKGGFPEPSEANERIVLITVQDINAHHFYTWGFEDFENTRDDVTYFKCYSEKHLLEAFLQFWTRSYPDIITGWNCVNKESNLWYDNHIGKIDTVKENDILVDSSVLTRFPYTNKPEVKTTLYGGMTLSTSEDHRFLCYVIPKEKYTNFRTATYQPIELSLKDITLLRKDNEVFFVFPKHTNTNKALTYGDFICLCWDTLKEKGEWNVEGDITEYVKTHETLSVKLSTHSTVSFNLRETISDDVLHTLGLVYTDGTIDSNQLRVYNTNLEIIENVGNTFIANSKKKSKIYNSIDKRHVPWLYSTNITRNSRLGVLLSFIHDGVNKKLNIDLLSRLSASQWWAFFAGCVDGDGWVKKHGDIIGWCNYNGDIPVMQELLLWNGCFSTSNKEYTRLIISSKETVKIKHNIALWATYKLDRLKNKTTKLTCASKAKGKSIDYRELDDSYIVKVIDITKTEKVISMIDIETSTHWFLLHGVRTHNCDYFDNTYIYNRMKKVLGEKEATKLSPYGDVEQREIIPENAPDAKPDITTSFSGIACLDYLRVYKKFGTYSAHESYKLDDIAAEEIGWRKIPNPTGYGFREFMTGEFEVPDKPEDDAHEIRKLGYERTKLRMAGKANSDEYKALDERIKQLCKQTFVEYNIRDVELIAKLDHKLKLLDIVILVAYIAHENYEDTFSPVKTWDYTIYHYLNERGYVIPIKKKSSKKEKFAGAFVKSPLIGKHEYCESFDLD